MWVLTDSRILTKVRNGAKSVASEVVGTFVLILLSGLVLEIEEHCLSLLLDKCCSVYMNHIFYISAPLINELYPMDIRKLMHTGKRVKPNGLNCSCIWHSGLGYIGVKRISESHSHLLFD